MYSKSLFILFLLGLQAIFSQTKEEILQEAEILYKSEKASWHGTDIFLDRFPDKKELIEGYFSYSPDSITNKVLFFDSIPKVLATISFNNDFQRNSAVIDSLPREFTSLENEIYRLRQKAVNLMYADTLFKHYKNTRLNPIPIVTGNKKKVYVLTGPEITGVVIFGNDYLIEFNNEFEVISKKALHNNIIPIYYKEEETDLVTIHSHNEVTGDLITPTDICTLKLYQDYAKWKQHIVMSSKNVSLWNCKEDRLTILTKEAWEKIYGSN
ncbi:hypothetical protein FGF1_37270 [Flavobacteriaceae bacterium GF1]